ncbi:hypothetical protein ZIOFF_009729 [Zingiber officinale]|uniref:Uncharacterized protein n=1 Tax=Zingiber officinale TaxID=94328 RepID=A0A8J5HHQ7_ZINOF|nr:hypothetical protein ZIOFF_009729 [Zingiber officinale]
MSSVWEGQQPKTAARFVWSFAGERRRKLLPDWLALRRGFSDFIFGMSVVFATLVIVRCSGKLVFFFGLCSIVLVYAMMVLEELRLTMDQFIDLCILSDVIIVIALKYDNACVVEYGASAATVPCLCYLDLI